MKWLKRLLFSIALLLFVSVIADYFVLKQIKTAALPDYSKDVTITGLWGGVTIVRDSFAIPHIYAENEIDLYRAVGFTMAQDRLWQMDLLRRVIRGQLSEIMGKSQLETDLLMRSLRIQEKSERLLAQAAPEIVAILEAFSAGVNYYIGNYPLPFEFRVLGYKPEPWQPLHSYNLIGYLSWDLTSGWRYEMLLHQLSREVSPDHLAGLMPDMKNHPTAVFPGFGIPDVRMEETILSAARELPELGAEVFQGSNNWAVSGRKSKTGKPLLANDMHLRLFAPGIWYQMHHVAKGSLNVTGVVLPGQPFVVCGHNDSIAWGMTNVAVDDIDFYAETLNGDSTQYLLDGQWRDLIIKEEIIPVKGDKPVKETLKFTHRGPFINRFKKEDETPVSMRWTGNETSNEMRSVFLLNRAGHFEDFRNAVSTMKSVSQNVIYADVAGNIGLQTCAGVPIREGNGIRITPGDTSLYDWTGFVPFEQLPFEFNPDRGYVSSANNKTVPDDYPYYVGTWFYLPDRIDRIREMLEETDKHGMTDFARIQADCKSKKAGKFMPAFLASLQSSAEWNEIQQTALQKLQEWDHVLSRESQAASLFEVLFRKTAENLIKDDLPDNRYTALMGEQLLMENLMASVMADENSPWIDDQNTPGKESRDDIVKRAFRETVDELKDQLGADVEKWSWGKLHTLTLQHPLGVIALLNLAFQLNRGPFGVPGSYHTASPYSYSYNNLYHVYHGASQRHIFNLADWDASLTVIPTGTSGIPASEFYMDQTRLYLENRYHKDPFSPEEVFKEARFMMKLLPEED
jgi:penicillin G amidase